MYSSRCTLHRINIRPNRDLAIVSTYIRRFVGLHDGDLGGVYCTMVCSRPEDGLRCRQGVKPSLNLKRYRDTGDIGY